MKFFFSIATAIGFGVLAALAGISGVEVAMSRYFYEKPVTAEGLLDTALGAHEEDPTFISSFSRGMNYRGIDDATVEQSIFGNLPATVLEGAKDGSRKISALAYSVTDIDRNTIILEKDAERQLPIASITKLVTAVIAKKHLDLDDTVKITPRIFVTEGNTGKLRLNETFKVKEILFPLLMVSSNDAAEALAAAYGRTAFIKEMNDWANGIGAYRTYFADPSGLSPNNLSTAKDISIIMKWIRENEPDIFAITLMKQKTIRSHTWVNPTHFLNLSSYEGGKNGYTTEANRTTASLFSLGTPPRLYSVVLLGGEQRDADMLAVLNEAFK